MSPLEWILIADAVALIAIAIGSTDTPATGARCPVVYLNGRARTVAVVSQPPRRARRARRVVSPPGHT